MSITALIHQTTSSKPLPSLQPIACIPSSGSKIPQTNVSVFDHDLQVTLGKLYFGSTYPPHSNSGNWRFIGMIYKKHNNPFGNCYWVGVYPSFIFFASLELFFWKKRGLQKPPNFWREYPNILSSLLVDITNVQHLSDFFVGSSLGTEFGHQVPSFLCLLCNIEMQLNRIIQQ